MARRRAPGLGLASNARGLAWAARGQRSAGAKGSERRLARRRATGPGLVSDARGLAEAARAS